ncbi:MAG: energy transducer TonB [Planctomycetes bacterium]|nr:energy transducer TonB [Planctomycetota bacterium]MCB9886679.1 energy transducer TonB [Planctomycetota bacterium]
MSDYQRTSKGAGFGRLVRTALGAVLLTAAFFFVLPLTQAIGKEREDQFLVREIDTAIIEPPPPPPLPEPEKPEEPDPPPDEPQNNQPLELSQLELALNPGLGGGVLSGDFTIKLDALGGAGGDVDSMFSLADLDQKPRPIMQTNPTFTRQMLKGTPVTVYVLCVIDELGRVTNPVVQTPGDPQLDNAALAAIKQWRYEPGKRKGKPVRFRLRQPITFPKK